MGGGGGGTFGSRTPEELIRAVRKAEDEAGTHVFEAELSTLLNGLLAAFNGRDVKLVRQRLEEVKDALFDVAEGSYDQFFGGSVAKHTYVDGLSDIDSLIVVNDTTFSARKPHDILRRMSEILSAGLSGVIKVTYGRMAVTVHYQDGMILQILPAVIGKNDRLYVPSSRREGWSRIEPSGFQKALTSTNQECAGKLVPTIKLAKAIIGELPESQRLSGYHVESLAIAAFRNYMGEKTTSVMLPTFFERARDFVMSPIRDSTGQSVHVDEYLGEAGSPARTVASHLLGRIAKRMRNATAAASASQWRALFGYDL
jgi:hypothetical protein